MNKLFAIYLKPIGQSESNENLQKNCQKKKFLISEIDLQLVKYNFQLFAIIFDGISKSIGQGRGTYFTDISIRRH